MSDNELLLALSDMLDKKLKPIKEDIQFLKLQNENDILPRLQNIESCYKSTYNRYKSSVNPIDSMQHDIDIMKIVISEHSRKLQSIE